MASNLESSLAAKGSDTIWDFSCNACSKNEAQFHCEGCYKCYCENCVTLHNQLFNSHIVLGRERTKEWPVAKSTLDILQKCTEHNQEKIKLYCEDHSRLCCHICVALHHRTCKIAYILEETNKYSTEDVYQLSSNIQKVIEDMKKEKDVADCNLQSLEKTHARIKEELDNMRQKINAALDLLEKATIKKVDKMIANFKSSVTKERDEFSSLQERLERFGEALNEVCNKSSKLLFIAFEQCQQQIQISELFLKELKYKQKYDMDFAPNIDIENFLSKWTELGRINTPNTAFSLQKMSEFRVNVSSDKRSCGIYAICELPSGESLVLDYKNNEVKLFDKKHQFLSNCELSNIAFDMCLTSPSEVVVTMKERGQKINCLQMITVSYDKLVKGRNLKLPHECVGIAHHDGDLYVTSGNALYHYTLTGTLVKKVYDDKKGHESGMYRCAVSLKGDKIYVTNKDKHTLLTLAKDGTVISTFSDLDLKDPRGVNVTPSGQVLVCGASSNTIVQVDGEGKKKLATLATEKDGMKEPCSVFYNCSTDLVIVGSHLNDKIMVFKVT